MDTHVYKTSHYGCKYSTQLIHSKLNSSALLSCPQRCLHISPHFLLGGTVYLIKIWESPVIFFLSFISTQIPSHVVSKC